MQRPSNHVWVAGVGSAADEAEVLRCCKEGAIPAPEHLLKVGATIEGLWRTLLHFVPFCCMVGARERGRVLGCSGSLVCATLCGCRLAAPHAFAAVLLRCGQVPGPSCFGLGCGWFLTPPLCLALVQVPARRPGLLLVFRDTAVAETAVAAIRAGRPRILGPPGGPPPGGPLPVGRPGLLPGGASAAADSGSPAPRRGRDEGGRERDSGSGRERVRERERGGPQGDGGSEPAPPEFASRTLWVGQVSLVIGVLLLRPLLVLLLP